MDAIKGRAIEGFAFEMINKSSGEAVTTGTVNGYITKDGGVQETLSMVPVHEGNGQWSVNLSAAEMTADYIGLLFTHTDGVPVHFTIRTFDRDAMLDILNYAAEAGMVQFTDIAGEQLQLYYYGTISRASTYFENRLGTQAWDDATANDRQSSLIMATRAIDKLNFAGDKADTDQELQFPRNDDTEVPIEVEYACYEIALCLLDGYSQEQEVETLGVLSETYSGVRTTYDAYYVNEHKRAGIPSIEAWELLKPFLRDPRQLRMSRVS